MRLTYILKSVFKTTLFLALVCVYELRAKTLRREKKCKKQRYLHCECAKRKDVFGHREMHPFCRERNRNNICNENAMITKYSNYQQCVKNNGIICPPENPYCNIRKHKPLKNHQAELIQQHTHTLTVGPLVKCSLNEKIRKTNPNMIIPDEKKAYYCDFEANEKFSKLDYGDGGTFDNRNLVKFINHDASLASKLNIKIDQCICADLSGANIQDCKDIFLCDITCDGMIQKHGYQAMCNANWYQKFCSMKCGNQHIKPRKAISKVDGFDPTSHQFSVETKINEGINIYSVGHILKKNINSGSLEDLHLFVKTLANNIDFKTNGLRSHVHEDWLNTNKLQCHTLSDKSIGTLLDLESLDPLQDIIRNDIGVKCAFKKGWSNAILDGDKRLFQRCETNIAQNSIVEPFLAKKFVRRLFLDDFENGFVTGARFIKEYAKLKDKNDVIKFIVSLTEEDISHCNSIDRINNIVKFLNLEKAIPFCKTVIGFSDIEQSFFIREEDCVNLKIPNIWKNKERKHTPVHKKENRNKQIKILSTAKYCRSTDGHFDSQPLDYLEGGVCLTRSNPRRLKTMNNGHYLSKGGFNYPQPVEYTCNEFNNSRYDRIRLVFETPDDVTHAQDLGVDEADGRHQPFFDNSLTVITKQSNENSGKVLVEFFSTCKDRKKNQMHSGLINFGSNYNKQPYLINIKGDTDIIDPPFTNFRLDEELVIHTKAWVSDEMKATEKIKDIHINDLTDFQKILYTVHSKNDEDDLHIISASVCSHEDIDYLYKITNGLIKWNVLECIVTGKKCKEVYETCPMNPSMHFDVQLDKKNAALWLLPKHELIHKQHGPMRVSESCNVHTINYFLELLQYHETVNQFSYAITKTACVDKTLKFDANNFFLLQRQLLQNQQALHKSKHNSCKHYDLCIDNTGATIKTHTATERQQNICKFNVDLGLEERRKTSWDALLVDPMLYLRSYKKQNLPLKFDVVVYNVKKCGQQTNNFRRVLLSDMTDISFGGGVSSVFNILAALNNTTPQMISFADSLINNNNEVWKLSANTPAAREELYEKIAQMYTEDMLCLHKAYFLYIGLAFGAYYILMVILSAIFLCFPDSVTGKSISIYYQPNAQQ